VDIFSIFNKGQAVYELLQKDNPEVNLTLPVLNGENANMSVAICASSKPKTISVTGDNDFRKYAALNKTFRGSAEVISQNFDYFLNTLSAFPTNLYQDFCRELRVLFTRDGQFIFTLLSEQFKHAMKVYFSSDPLPNDVQMIFYVSHPAKIVVYSSTKDVSSIYTFSDNKLRLTGFKDQGRVPDSLPGVFRDFFQVDEVVFVPDFIVESCGAEFYFSSEHKHYLSRNSLKESIENETADEVLDKVIQSLVLIDMLDALCDVVIDEEETGLVLCFDPILKKLEIEFILMTIKQKYSTAMLVSSEQDDDVWCIAIYREEKTTNLMKNSGQNDTISSDTSIAGDIGIKSDTVLDQAAKDIDLDALVNSMSD
jgi:hypothetical protein